MTSRREREDLWRVYEAAMLEARDASLALATAIEKYLRMDESKQTHRGQDVLAEACARYYEATEAAAPFHFGCVPPYTLSWLYINAYEDELLGYMRGLRGTAVPHRVDLPGGVVRSSYRYERDGVAGFFQLEVDSMRPFRSPRRGFLPGSAPPGRKRAPL